MSAGREPAARRLFPAFLAVAAGVHALGLVLLAPAIWRAPEPQAAMPAGPVRAASPEIAALVEHWNTPPETGEAAALGEVAAETDPPDTAEAARAETGVEAGEASDLGEVSGPGKAPKRPIFAPKIDTPTAPPPQIALRLPEPSGFSPAAAAMPGDAGPGSALGGLASPGGGLGAGPGPSAGPSLALPTPIEEESFAPETAPFPVPRPDPAAIAALEAAAEAAEEEDLAPLPDLPEGPGAVPADGATPLPSGPALPGPAPLGGALPSLPRAGPDAPAPSDEDG